MLKDEFIKWVQKALVGDASEKEILLQYIVGETDILPKNLSTATSIYNGPDWMLYASDPETRAVISRFFIFVTGYMPDKVSLEFSIGFDRYRFFHLLNLSDTFIKQDIIYQFTGHKFKFWTTSDHFYNIMGQIFDNYPHIAALLLQETEQDTGEMQTVFIVLLTFTVYRQRKKGLPIDGRWESVVFALMRTQFSDEEIEKIFTRHQTTPETLKHFKDGPLFSINIDDKLCERLLYFIHRFCHNITPVSEDAICLTMLLKPVRSVARDCRWNTRDPNEEAFFDNHSLSWIVLFRHRIFKSICRWLNSIESINAEPITDVVESCLATHEKEYFYILNDFSECRDLSAAPLIAHLLKQGRPEGKEHLAWMNERLTEVFNQYLWEDAGVGGLSEKYQVLARNFDLNDRGAQAPVFTPFCSGMVLSARGRFDTFELMLSSVHLMDYSVIALNIVKLISKNLRGNVFREVDLFGTCNFFRKNTNENILSFLYETGLQFDVTIRAFLYQYHCIKNAPPALRAQFLEFLIQHKEEAEKAIPFLDIDDNCMVDYLKTLFEVSQCFNIKKALLAFQKKTPVVLKYLEELLEDKEDFVRQEVEALQNSKHKGTAETAARLVRLWDNRIMGVLLDAQPDSRSFMAQIEKRYTKFHEQSISQWSGMPYRTIRMVDSDTVLSEKVIKYYLAEYMLLETIYPINACLKIQQKANLDDLRHLLKKIYETWLADSAPVKQKNLLLPFALTAGETEILILKNQIAEWSGNGNPALASFAVKGLFMNGSESTIMLIKEIAKNNRNKKVRTAALEALTPIS